MHFGLSWEQQSLRDAVTGYLGELPSARDVLEGDGRADDPAVWQRICTEQGWQAIAIPEEAGGFGFGQVELAVIFEALGRTLTPCPLLGVSMATAALIEAGAGAHPYLARIAEGQTAALVPGITAREHEGDWVLTGTADQVVDAGAAALFVLLTDVGVFAVPAAEVAVASLPAFDITRSLGRVSVDLTVPEDALLGSPDPGAVAARIESLLAAEATGAADATLEMAVEYAKVRVQYGKPIGSFQAIQHLCADMLVHVESARSAAWYAAWSIAHGSDDSRRAARVAKATASEALLHCAGANIQIHGGIGFTWEHDAHLYFKRAQATHALFGDPAAHRAALADALLGAL